MKLYLQFVLFAVVLVLGFLYAFVWSGHSTGESSKNAISVSAGQDRKSETGPQVIPIGK